MLLRTPFTRSRDTVPQRRWLALVSLYRGRNGAPVHGVDSYTRALASALKRAGVDLEVWGDRARDACAHLQDDEGLPAIRAWRKGLWVGVDLWRTMRVRRPIILHAQIQYFMFGGMPGFASVMAFLAAARLMRQKIVVTMHDIVSLKDLTAEVLHEFGLPLSVGLARGLLRISTALLCQLVHRMIVHDEVFRQRLTGEYGVDPTRVEVIPHGVAAPEELQPAAQRTGTIVLFGYLKWYKGIDIALRGFREVARDFPNWKLVIAGGLPPDLTDDHPHKRYLADLRTLAASLGRQVKFTGYIDDSAIPTLLERADIVLFPYRLLFASSGPLALTIGFRKPFVLSEALRPLLPTWPLWCANAPGDWAAMMRRLMLDPEMCGAVREMVEELASVRSWRRVAAQTLSSYRSIGDYVRAPSRSP